MKSMKFLLLMGVAVLTLFSSSCSKDKDKTRKEILLSKSWTLTAQKIVSTGTDIPIEDCNKDDYITFKEDGTYVLYHGTTLCDPNETNETGTWSLSADEKTITVDGENGAIQEMTETIIIVQVTTIIGTVEQTFKPKS